MKWKLLKPSKLNELIAANKSIYVLNTSVTPAGGKGTVMLTIYDGTRREYVKIPPTFIPIAVTDAISPRKLQDSSDFKASLVKGMLTLVDPAQAAAYLESPEAVEEYENLMLSEHSARRTIEMEAEVGKRATPRNKVLHNQEEGPMDQDVSRADTVSNRIRALMEDLTSGSQAADQVRAELKRQETAMNEIDISYVIASTNDTKIQQWAQQALKSHISSEAHVQPAAKAKATKAKAPASRSNDSAAFDFQKDVEMTPEEAAADAKAKAKYASQQALGGESKAAQLIDQLIKTHP